MVRLLCLLIGYAFGLIQTGYIIGRFFHDDIRKHGSGNAGTTNALRVYGKAAGLITLLVDALKTVAAILVVTALFGKQYTYMLPLLKMYAGAGAILGHNFPFYLKFRGGKGVAASLGFCIGFDWRLLLVISIVFLAVVIATRYVSLGSLAAYTAAFVTIIVLGQTGCLKMEQRYLTEMYILFAGLYILVFYRHRANISRLMSGTENKLSLSSKKK